MQIGEVAARTGLSIDTLRFYEKIGLIPPPPRDGGGRRVYPDGTIGWVAFLGQLSATGMRQADRIRYAALRAQGAHTVPVRRAMLEAHRDEIRARIAELDGVLALMDRKVAAYREMEAKGETDG